MVTEPEQEPDNYSKLRERVLRTFNMPWYCGYKHSRTKEWHGYLGNIPIT